MNDLSFTSPTNGPTCRSMRRAGAGPAAAGDGPEPSPLTQYLRIARRWKWLILGSIVAALLVGLILTLLTTPLYTGDDRLEISARAPHRQRRERRAREPASVDMEFYQTQYGLLQSRSLAERVARRAAARRQSRLLRDVRRRPTAVRAQRARQARQRAARRADRARARRSTSCCDNVDVSPIRLSRLVDISFTSPDPALVGARSPTPGRSASSSRPRAALRGDLLCAQLPRGTAGAAAPAARGIGARSWSAMPPARRIINIPIAPRRRRAAPQRAVDDRRRPRRAQRRAGAGDRASASRPQSRMRSAAAAPSTRGARTITAIARPAPAPRRGRGRICPAADPVRAGISAGAGACRPDRAARPDASPARKAGSQRALRDAYRDSVDARAGARRAGSRALKAELLDLRRRSIQYNIFQRDVDTNRAAL